MTIIFGTKTCSPRSCTSSEWHLTRTWVQHWVSGCLGFRIDRWAGGVFILTHLSLWVAWGVSDSPASAAATWVASEKGTFLLFSPPISLNKNNSVFSLEPDSLVLCSFYQQIQAGSSRFVNLECLSIRQVVWSCQRWDCICACWCLISLSSPLLLFNFSL